MTSCTWSSESPSPLLACGLDAERIERFLKLVGRERPWPAVFSAVEAEHMGGLPNPAEGFCASFCCKEALVKALERPYPFPQCELLYRPGVEVQELRLAEELRRERGIGRAEARLLFLRDGELTAVVSLYGA